MEAIQSSKNNNKCFKLPVAMIPWLLKLVKI